MPRKLSLIVLVTGISAACAPVAMEKDQTHLAGSSWTLSSFNGRIAPPLMTLKFESADRFSGVIECNSFGGTYTLRAGVIVPDNVTQTVLGCEYSPPPDATLRRSTKAVLAARQIPYSMRSEQLVLREGDNNLIFSRVP